MKITPRPYQQEAHDAVISWWKKSTESCVVSAATGAGKSLIISMIAKTLFDLSGGKRILCLAPSAELVKQNAEKYTSFGNECSIYSASISKSLRHQVIFATEGSFKSVAKRLGSEFAGVIVDECHRTTNTIKKIIDEMKIGSKNLRVCGLSASPYRLNDGYVYRYDAAGNPVPEDQTKEPFYNSLVYEITAVQLIEMGFLTKPHADPNHASGYDMSGVNYNDKSESDKAVEGKGRLTSSIVADVVKHSRNRMGVMIFAATVRHAQEIMASLPSDNSRMIGGNINMGKSERNKIVNDFKSMKYKYLVNVATMTTGVDFTHVDVIAILRATQSASLFQQIIGRALRLHPKKDDALILDYGQNIEHFQLESDLFSPQIKARSTKKGEPINVKCPLCFSTNQFTKRKSDDGDDLPIDDEGYQLDLAGNRIEIEGQFLPGHYGRRCFGFQMMPDGKAGRCEHRWSVKLCPTCQHENDITARDCESCGEELIDPNTKLSEQFHRMKADPLQVSTDEVREFSMSKWKSKAGNMTIKASYKTDYASFDVWYNPESKAGRIRNLYEDFSRAYYGGKIAPDIDTFMQHKEKGTPPKTITYQKQKGKQYWNVYAHNKPIDKEPEL